MRSLIHCLSCNRKIAEWSPLVWLGVSAIACCSLFLAAMSLSSSATENQRQIVNVYCASAVVKPMNKIIDQFNSSKLATSEKMVVNIVRSGGSGALAGQLNAETLTGVQDMADVFVCADSNRMFQLIDRNVIDERFPITVQFPVVAVRDDSDLNLNPVKDLRSLLNLEIKLGIGSVSSAIGFETDRVAKLKGCGQLLQTRKTAEFENVMSMAQALSLGSIDAAVVWDSTVVQFNQTDNQPIRFVAYLDSDKLSNNKTTRFAHSRCFVEVGRSKSTSHLADLFFNYLRDNRNKLLEDFVDAGFSNDLPEALLQ